MGMLIYVFVEVTQEQVSIDIEASDLIEGLFQKLTSLGVEVVSTRLTFEGVELQKELTFSYYDIQKNDVVVLSPMKTRKWPLSLLITLVSLSAFVCYIAVASRSRLLPKSTRSDAWHLHGRMKRRSAGARRGIRA